MFRKAFLVIAGLLCLAAAPLRADEAEDAFNQLYGDDLKRVLATPAPADDIALAKQLLDAARKAEKQPAFLALLCEKAYDLAAKDASGYPTATAAMDLLAEKVPEKKVEALQKTAALYQRQYTTSRADAKTKAGEALLERLSAVADAQVSAGDIDAAGASLKQALVIAAAIKSDARAAIQAQFDGLVPRKKMERQIAALTAKLEKNPEDAASRKELVRLLLVEEDNPAEAAKFVDESLDDATRKYVPAARKPVEEAPELACMELGDWYRGLAEGAATPASKGAMLRRAQGYYQRFLDLHKGEDLARTTASLILKRIEDALAKIPAPKAAPATWIDLLKKVDIEKNVVKGTWLRQGSALMCTPAGNFSRVMIPLPVSGNYEVQARVLRVSGTEHFVLLLPLKYTQIEWTCGYQKNSTLWSVRGPHVSVPFELETGREYEFQAKVLLADGRVSLTATVDGARLVSWEGPESAVSLNPQWSLPTKTCLGLGAQRCVVAFTGLRVRSLPAGSETPSDTPAAKLTAAWTDCLKLVDPARDAVKGKWELRGGQLFSTERGGLCHLSFPIVLKQSYEVQATVARTAGDDACVLSLPAGKGAFTLVLSGDRGAWHRLEFIDGQIPPAGPAVVRPGTLVNGQDYVVDVKVFLRGEDAEIAATMDGKPFLQWKGRQASLSRHPNWALPDPRCMGVGTWQAEAVVRRMQVRALPGDARPAAEAPAPKPKG